MKYNAIDFSHYLEYTILKAKFRKIEKQNVNIWSLWIGETWKIKNNINQLLGHVVKSEKLIIERLKT